MEKKVLQEGNLIAPDNFILANTYRRFSKIVTCPLVSSSLIGKLVSSLELAVSERIPQVTPV